MKIARIFQQCTNCCEKQDELTYLRLNKITAEPLLIKKIRHEKDDIFKNELSKKRCRKCLAIQRYK
jgi:hypothetical protein